MFLRGKARTVHQTTFQRVIHGISDFGVGSVTNSDRSWGVKASVAVGPIGLALRAALALALVIAPGIAARAESDYELRQRIEGHFVSAQTTTEFELVWRREPAYGPLDADDPGARAKLRVFSGAELIFEVGNGDNFTRYLGVCEDRVSGLDALVVAHKPYRDQPYTAYVKFDPEKSRFIWIAMPAVDALAALPRCRIPALPL